MGLTCRSCGMGFGACCGCACARAIMINGPPAVAAGSAPASGQPPQRPGGAPPHPPPARLGGARDGPRRGPARAPPTRVAPAAANSSSLPELLAWAARLGLTGSLDGDADEEGADGESALAARLRRDVRARARETLDVGRLRTALAWCDDFVTDTRREPLFKRLENTGDLEAMVHNQTTLDMFAEYIRQTGSRKSGRKRSTLRSDTIQTYVATIKLLRGSEARYHITCPQVNVVAPAAHKRMRQQDGAPGDRTLCRGMRSHMLRELARCGWDRLSRRGAVEWAAALTAHNLLLRGGEVGSVDQKPFDTSRDITIGSVHFKTPSAESEYMPWLTIDVVPIKDTVARKRVCPMPVRRRSHGGNLGDDPLDVYDAIVLAIKARTGRLPPRIGRVKGIAGIAPLFVKSQGGEWKSADSRALARRMASALGLAPADFGGKSFRVGGATDWRAVLGESKAERIIRQRGRWDSDIHKIYERALAHEHLSGSAMVGNASGAELEALCAGWAQPASFR